jgi:hypothetical protein
VDPISHADRLAALLRQRLAERSRADRAGQRGAHSAAGDRTVDRVEALGAAGEGGGRGRRRILVETILSDELGPHLLNDPGFQQVVDRVVDALEADAAASDLLGRAVEEAGREG